MIEFLTRVSLAGLSKNAQLQLSAFIEGFTKVCMCGMTTVKRVSIIEQSALS
jgi:hypothetical protein